MNTIINGEEYHIFWKHNNNVNVVDNFGKPVRSSSQCFITISGGGVLTGTALCHPGDGFNKKKGRKLSFARAVENITDRSIRTALWDTYWKSFVKIEVIPIMEVSEEQLSMLNTIADIQNINDVLHYTINKNTFTVKLKEHEPNNS